VVVLGEGVGKGGKLRKTVGKQRKEEKTRRRREDQKRM
tara:strand:- start:330 stop:443 length:114 start_codon:yes stop_codon:yes gene_type:complete